MHTGAADPDVVDRTVDSFIWQGGFPRSGSTRLRACMWHFFGMQSTSKYDESLTLTSSPEMAGLLGAVETRTGDDLVDMYERQGCVIMKTHNKLLPQEPQGRLIYVIRDGRDALTSYYRMWNQLNGGCLVTINQLIHGHSKWGTWSEHVKTWTPAAHLVVRFEDMFGRALLGVIDRLSEFFQREPRHAAVTLPPFEAFKAQHPQYFGGGTIGGWRDVFTDADAAAFDRVHGETLDRFYPEHKQALSPLRL